MSNEIVPAGNEGEATPQRDGAATSADSDIERRFNCLRRELLDDRSKQVDWWLTTTALILTTISIFIVFGGYFGFSTLRQIESEMRGIESEARDHLEDISSYRRITRSMAERDGVSAEIVNQDQSKADDFVRRVRENLDALPVDKAVSAAITLQNDGRIDEAIEKWRAIANIFEGSGNDLEYHAWFSVGFLSQENDTLDMEAAIDAYDKAIQLKPDFAEAYNNRGNAKSSLGRHDEAIVDHDKAIQFKPDFAKAYDNRGNAKSSLGRHDEAIADHDKAINIDPTYAAAYSNRGIAKTEVGRYDEAIADYGKAIQLKPDFAEAYNNRGNAKSSLGRHDEAIADYDEAIQLKPDFAKTYNNRGNAKGNLGRYDEAVADYDEAIRLKPDDAGAYNNRGNAKASLGRYDDAIADYDEAIRINPDYAEAFYSRGVAKHRQGLFQEARSDIEAALALARDANNDDLASRAQRYLESTP